MRKANVRVLLGLKMMQIDRTLTAHQVEERLDRTFKRMRLADMLKYVNEAGGLDNLAKMLVSVMQGVAYGQPPVKLAENVDKDVIFEKIGDVYNRLSPENLTCDGELPHSAVARKYRELQAELQRLFKLYGREVTEMECIEVWQKNQKAS